ncbi:MAG: multidrug efflux SMR transporter [Myxococcales bacterium]|nr:multidrug efflux SMR transporter [Myxococcales bacterium]
MSWFYVIIAGLLETGWAIGLKYTDGFTRPLPSVLTLAAIVLSMWLLALAARTLPIGTAYAVWVGIGALGTAILGVALFREPLSVARALCLLLLIAAIVGLKLTAPPESTGAAPPG